MTEGEGTLRKRPGAWHVASLTWQVEGPDGTRYALLEGRRNVPGAAFTYAFFLPAGFWDPPHWHSQDARIIVVEGALRLNYGTVMDPSNAREYPTGSILHVPANAVHFDGATEDTTVIGVAQGLWKTDYLDPIHQGSAGTIAGESVDG